MCVLPIVWLSSKWLSSASLTTLLLLLSPFIFIQVFRNSSDSIVITAYSAAPSPPNRSFTHSTPFYQYVPMDPFHHANLQWYLWGLVTLCCNLKVTLLLMFWAWYLDICCVCLFPDVLSNCFLIKLPSISLLLKFFPAFLNVIHGNPFQFCLGVFFLLPICFPFTALLARGVGLWLNILFSLWKMLSILSQISVIPTFEAMALK